MYVWQLAADMPLRLTDGLVVAYFVRIFYHLMFLAPNLLLNVLSLPCNAMQAWPMLSRGVCLSVCLSVTLVNFVKTNKHIFKIFHYR